MCACIVVFSLWTCTSLCMPLLICGCVFAVLILWKNMPAQWHDFMLSKVETVQSGLPVLLCAGLRLLSRDGGVALLFCPRPVQPIRSALIGPPFPWHSCLLEFWALLFFVALHDDLGSPSALALQQLISKGSLCWRMVLGTRFALRCSSQFHCFQITVCRVIKYMCTY